MKNKNLALLFGTIITSTFILFFSCKKINEPTELGDELIPPIDNITTFDTTLNVQVFNDSFTVVTDSTISDFRYPHYLGRIDNDPLFGRTNAEIYLELKPSTLGSTSYASPFINKPDSLNIDSVVLILDYVETYGDTTVPQTIDVFEMGGQIEDFRHDTAYRIRYPGFATLGSLGSRTVIPSTLNDSVDAFLDSNQVNQLRIRLNNSFGQRLLNYDTSNAYKNDTLFRQNFKGFALRSSGGNAIMGFNLNGTNTKLAIYYKDDNNNAPVADWDTAVAYFNFTSLSAQANLIRRDHSGSPLAAAIGGAVPDDMVYIQATPGTFATIKIPDLAALNNRVVHRAELIMEQVYDPSDTLFPPPQYLMLDAFDPSISGYRAVPYDFFFDLSSGSTNIEAFGGLPFITTDPNGKAVKVWRFNLSRYVQHIVTDSEPVYDLRLHAPTFVPIHYRPGPLGSSSQKIGMQINSAPGKGRVRLRGGDPSTTDPQRMRLRIVYSKI